jgi:hypothetical protein
MINQDKRFKTTKIDDIVKYVHLLVVVKLIYFVSVFYEVELSQQVENKIILEKFINANR